MDFKEMYAQKKMTAEQAAALVKSGDWVEDVYKRQRWVPPKPGVMPRPTSG